MKILLTSVGSRGDIEPFLAIGELLRAQGHDVVCLFPEQFRELCVDTGFCFESLGKEFLELIESPEGVEVLASRSVWKRLCAGAKLAKRSLPVQKEMVFKQKKVLDEGSFDVTVFHIKAMYPLIWRLVTGKKAVLVCPFPYFHATKEHPPVSLSKSLGPFFNRLLFSLADTSMALMIKKAMKELGIKKHRNSSKIKMCIQNTTAIYTLSPSLFPKPSDYPENVHILGYREKNTTTSEPLSKDLELFLNHHEKVLFVTFGSIINPDPEKNTAIFLEIFEKHGIPAVIGRAAGAFKEPASYNKDLFYFTHGVSYKELLPKVYGIIHHGGAGTTHSGLKHGCATLIIPHIVDQFIWNNQVSKKGAGPKGVSIGKMTKNLLEPLVLDLYHNKKYKDNALKIKHAMIQENFETSIVKIITDKEIRCEK